MLYKKYHRNYVRQFKNGVKLNIIHKYSDDSFINSEVREEPFVNHCFLVGISIVDSHNYQWFIVYNSGMFNDKIKIVGENAV